MTANIDDIVEVVFQDHAEDATEPIRCVVWGRMVQKTRSKITIRVWDVLADTDTVEANKKEFVIVRKAVEQVNLLKSK